MRVSNPGGRSRCGPDIASEFIALWGPPVSDDTWPSGARSGLDAEVVGTMKSIAFLAILLLAGCASAASVPWENLQATVLDKQVVVRDTDGVSTRAVVRGINDREVMLVRGNGEAVTIPRERVERVQLWSRGTGRPKG